MPGFQKVGSNNPAWSDISGNTHSKDIETGSKDRPTAEVRLSKRKVEIRTGNRVKRARGYWTAFKRGMTNAKNKMFSKYISVEKLKSWKLRHAGYKFDKGVNKLVEEMANNPKLTTKEVSRRLNEIVKQGKIIQANSTETVSDIQLKNRFRRNLDESLMAVQNTSPKAFRAIEKSFKRGGKFEFLSEDYTHYSDKDYKGLEAFDKHEAKSPGRWGSTRPTMLPKMRARLAKPEDPILHEFGQALVLQMRDSSPRTRLVTSIETPTALDSPIKGTFRFKQKHDSDLNSQLNTLNTWGTGDFEDVKGYDFNKAYLSDFGQQSVVLKDKSGKRTNLRKKLTKRLSKLSDEENISDVSKEIAGRGLSRFVNSLGMDRKQKRTAMKNLSKLLNHRTLELHRETAMQNLSGNLGVQVQPNMSGDVKRMQLSVEKGKVLFTAKRKMPIVKITSNDSQKTVDLDPNKTNTLGLSITLSMNIEDLKKEPLKFEVVEARTEVSLDLHNARTPEV